MPIDQVVLQEQTLELMYPIECDGHVEVRFVALNTSDIKLIVRRGLSDISHVTNMDWY